MADMVRAALCALLAALGLGAPRCEAPGLTGCTQALEISSPGSVTDPALTEISGIAAGRRNPDGWWVHNDSGDSARVFALGPEGATRRVYTVSEAAARDWEDLALGPGPRKGVDYLYLADIGDNRVERDEVVVYRVPEPDVTTGPDPLALDDVSALHLRYPDGPRDAETLLVDPRTGDLFIVGKRYQGGAVHVFRAPPDLAAGSVTTLTDAGTVVLPEGVPNAITGGDVSVDGRQVVLRTYGTVRLFERRRNQTIPEALAGASCLGLSPEERQGEAIAFDPDGRGYVTIGEGEGRALNHISPR
ncbi:MAG: hypothetical protein FJW88_14155 [Actinobacteria bacterium]|nr:hypothetical protein [Actinomycetota bacterium]